MIICADEVDHTGEKITSGFKSGSASPTSTACSCLFDWLNGKVLVAVGNINYTLLYVNVNRTRLSVHICPVFFCRLHIPEVPHGCCLYILVEEWKKNAGVHACTRSCFSLQPFVAAKGGARNPNQSSTKSEWYQKTFIKGRFERFTWQESFSNADAPRKTRHSRLDASKTVCLTVTGACPFAISGHLLNGFRDVRKSAITSSENSKHVSVADASITCRNWVEQTNPSLWLLIRFCKLTKN